jgi:hypothetical protein
VEGLPRSANTNCILVVVDKFTRYAYFIPLLHHYTASSIAQAFMKSVYRLHGLPTAIISSCDPIFTSKFWSTLFKLAGTSLKMSSSYHPQSDGQTKCVNQCMEMFLRCFVHACPSKWKMWLSTTEFWYNTSFHFALRSSPFEALYGRQPRLLDVSPNQVPAGNLDDWLAE